MSEMAKTLVFVALAVVALLAAFFVGPTEDQFNAEELVGQRLNQFEIDEPKRLKIVTFDTATASVREFEVAEDQGLWTIPSKKGYPADATQQMAEAATCLMDREVLRIAATNASQHAALGVVNPSSSNLDTQAQGVGIRVIMSDNSNRTLTDMIIGKPVKEADGQYYLRNTDQDVVYVVALNPEKLTTQFEDWIESDLLQINPFDIRTVQIQDYSAELMLTLTGLRAAIDKRGELLLRYDDKQSQWAAEKLEKFDPASKQLVPYTLADDEELDQEALRKMRDGLDDLRIVDVERKPAGLSADLKAGADFIKDNETALDLIERGFAPISAEAAGAADILSTEGEVVCSMRDGVEYVLRFGNLQLDSEEGGNKEDSATEADAEAKAKDQINRYLFVMARFNQDLIEQPALDELPELPAEAQAAEAPPAEEEEEEEEEEFDPAATGEPASDGAGQTGASDAPTEEAEEATGEPASAGGETDSNLQDLIAARKAIEQENQRRLDEYQEQIKKGQEHVQELNERFGDWYYVISNDVYQQIHLGLDKVVKKKEAPQDGDKKAADGAAPGMGLPNLPFGGATPSTK